MPVRKIPIQTRSVRGRVPRQGDAPGVEAESLLELDFATLLRFNPDVERFEEQPLVVNYFLEGKWHRYTPDFYVTFRPNSGSGAAPPPWVCEIKYQEDLDRHAEEYRPKFEAAALEAKERGAEFHVFDEGDIRTPYFYNAEFLLPRMQRVPEEEDMRLVLNQLYELNRVTVEGLMVSIYRDPWMRARLLPVLWYLVGHRRVGLDLDLPITNASEVWSLGPGVSR